MIGNIFEIGDRVKYILKYSRKTGFNNALDGLTGTIVYIVNDYTELYYHVQFDKPFSKGHDCNGYCKDGYGYSVDPIYLELEDNTNNTTKIRWYKNGKLSAPIEEKKPIYSDFITDDDFRNFLIDNDAYDEYIESYKSSSKFFDLKRSKYIEGAFGWINTKSGFDYWEKLSYKWVEQLKRK